MYAPAGINRLTLVEGYTSQSTAFTHEHLERAC